MGVEKREVDYVDEDRDRPVMRTLPQATRRAIGKEIDRIQRGEEALQWRPLAGFGRGVGELKRGKWRVVLSCTVDPACVWILCVFAKDSSRGSRMRTGHRELIQSRIARLAIRLNSAQPTLH